MKLDPAVLNLDAAQITGSTWGFLMDTRFAEGDTWFSLATFAEGSTSLYTSGTFGIIGGGAHETVRRAAAELLRLVGSAVDGFTPSDDTSLPAPGMVTMRALTFGGHKTIAAPEAVLGGGAHPASSIFFAAHQVISELRSLEGLGG